MTVTETFDIVAKIRVYCLSTHFRSYVVNQPHYFFIILGQEYWDILTVIPCERMIIGNRILAMVKPDHYMILLCCQSPTRTP